MQRSSDIKFFAYRCRKRCGKERRWVEFAIADDILYVGCPQKIAFPLICAAAFDRRYSTTFARGGTLYFQLAVWRDYAGSNRWHESVERDAKARDWLSQNSCNIIQEES